MLALRNAYDYDYDYDYDYVARVKYRHRSAQYTQSTVRVARRIDLPDRTPHFHL